MARIDVTVDIDIEDYLDEVSERDLIDELESRGYKVYKSYTPISKDRVTPKQQLDTIRDILGVQVWQGVDRIQENLRELIEVVGGI